MVISDGRAQRTLTIAANAHALTLHAGQGAETQALWLDGTSRLLTARFDAAFVLLRGPTEVAAHVARYTAVTLASGDLFILWSAIRADLTTTPLNLQIVDALGRPRTGTQIADDAAFIAVAHDTTDSGRVHVVWLEPQVGGTYALWYAQINDASLESGLRGVPSLVGIVAPARGSQVETLRIGAAAGRVYVAWDEIAASGIGPGAVLLLSFPPNDRTQTRQSTLARDARWPSLAVVGQSVIVGVSTGAGPGGISLFKIEGDAVTLLASIPAAPGVIGQTALVYDTKLTVVWPLFAQGAGTLLSRSVAIP